MKFNLIRYYLAIVLLVVLNISLFSQLEPCGTLPTNYKGYQKLKVKKNSSLRSEYLLPIKLHIVTDHEGEYEAEVDEIVSEIELSSNNFKFANIDFQLCEIGYIQNSDLFHFQGRDRYSLISSYNKPDVINIYILQSLTNESGDSLCGLAFYPWSTLDLILITHNCAINGSTMAHEIGHYLGLYHTHRTLAGSELVNQSNCENAGDLLCDTPADPRLSTRNTDSSCKYYGTKTDDNGQLYMPSTESIMSYSRKWCRNTFTSQQGVVMRNVCDQYYSSYECDENEKPPIFVFPNPTSNAINILLSRSSGIQTRLYSVDGLMVKETLNQTRIDIEPLADGVYILEICDIELGPLSIEKIVIAK